MHFFQGHIIQFIGRDDAMQKHMLNSLTLATGNIEKKKIISRDTENFWQQLHNNGHTLTLKINKSQNKT